jgi:hypothetical protein
MSATHPTPGIHLLLKLAVLAVALPAVVQGALTVANLNCTFLLSPATAAQLGIKPSAEANSIYGEKFDNLAKLIRDSGAEFVGLETIGAKREVEDLAVRLCGISGETWKGIFIPGAGRRSGRNLAVVYRIRRDLQINGAGPILDLAEVPNHLVFSLLADGTEYSVCLVDLTELDGPDPAAYALQLQALRSWARQQRGPAVIMGTFTDEHRKLPPLFSINERLGWPATELGNRGRDYIFSSRDFAGGGIVAPPYGTNPGGALRIRWTDHFLVKALVP